MNGSGQPAGRRFAIIAGGGTAGHLHPGLSVAQELVERGHDRSAILFVGSARGIEVGLVPEAGFELMALPGRGIERHVSVRAARSAASLADAVRRGIGIVRAERPAVVLSLGGYASVPCGLGAAFTRVPLVVAEQNAVPGAANRLVGRFARCCAVSFPGTPLPRAVVTGNPVRDAVLAVDRTRDRDRARAELGVDPDRTVVAVFGGSLGALRINRAIIDACRIWHDRDDLAVHHVVGARDWDQLAPACAELDHGALDYRAVRYEDRMPLVYAAADLMVARAGASTVAELAAVGAPSILVPLPGAPGDHQTANARALTQVGAAELIRDDHLDGPRLAGEVDRLIHEGRLDEMGSAASAAAHRDAAARVVDLLEEFAQ